MRRRGALVSGQYTSGPMEGSCTWRLERLTETPLWHRLELELLAVLHGSSQPAGADTTVEECGRAV
jgi:hypothetical protein